MLKVTKSLLSSRAPVGIAAVPLAPSRSLRVSAGMSKTSQWANARGKSNSGGKSGSVILIAKLLVPAGTQDHARLGDALFSSAKRSGVNHPAGISGGAKASVRC